MRSTTLVTAFCFAGILLASDAPARSPRDAEGWLTDVKEVRPVASNRFLAIGELGATARPLPLR